MTPAPHTLPASASVLDALAQLQGSGYRTVPVLCASGEPLGVLSILTLIRGALEQQAGPHPNPKPNPNPNPNPDPDPDPDPNPNPHPNQVSRA